MNAPYSPRRMVVQALLCVWLLVLSLAVVLGYRVMSDLAEQVQADAEVQKMQVLQARVAELAESVQALEARPAAASATALQDVRQTLQSHIAQLEQALGAFATADALQALRTEIEQLKARQAAARAAPAVPRRPVRPAVVAPQPEPFPYRVIGAELRAGQRSVSVVPINGELTAAHVQVLLPGDAIGAWRLQAIEGDTAVFQSGEQVRRLAIP